MPCMPTATRDFCLNAQLGFLENVKSLKFQLNSKILFTCKADHKQYMQDCLSFMLTG